jgi:hypothetical protein
MVNWESNIGEKANRKGYMNQPAQMDRIMISGKTHTRRVCTGVRCRKRNVRKHTRVIPQKTKFTTSIASVFSTHSFQPSMALQNFIGPWPLLRFPNLFYTGGRTPWTTDQPIARPLPTHRTTQTQTKRIHRNPCIEWDSNPRSQSSSGRRKFML